jgi:hypothetical protein
MSFINLGGKYLRSGFAWLYTNEPNHKTKTMSIAAPPTGLPYINPFNGCRKFEENCH